MQNDNKDKPTTLPEPIINGLTSVPAEPHLLEIVKCNLKALYCAGAAKAFMANPELKDYKQYNSSVQRGLANRVLINKLLVFRAHSDVKVVDAIYCLIPDGDNEAWMNVFKRVIIPFLKENKVKL